MLDYLSKAALPIWYPTGLWGFNFHNSNSTYYESLRTCARSFRSFHRNGWEEAVWEWNRNQMWESCLFPFWWFIFLPFDTSLSITLFYFSRSTDSQRRDRSLLLEMLKLACRQFGDQAKRVLWLYCYLLDDRIQWLFRCGSPHYQCDAQFLLIAEKSKEKVAKWNFSNLLDIFLFSPLISNQMLLEDEWAEAEAIRWLLWVPVFLILAIWDTPKFLRIWWEFSRILCGPDLPFSLLQKEKTRYLIFY